MKVSLWVLVDTGGRIIYTGNQEDIRLMKIHYDKISVNDYKSVELKGEYNVASS